MISYEKELKAIEKSNRLRVRKIYDKNLIDLASNDYLGLASNKKIFKKAYKRVLKENHTAPKASILVNGYSNIHKDFEDKLCELNGFESAVVVGSGFLANISLIESLVRKKDILFIDEQYHASGMVATKLVQGDVIVFKHNDYKDLENKLESLNVSPTSRVIIAIEGVYSMGGDIAPKEFNTLATKHNAILLLDEAHSSGVIGKNLLGWFDYWGISPKSNHIKMGTLGKAYGSYGAYILASKQIVTFLENRAKPIIYSTAPSLFDIALGLESLKYIIKNKKKLYKKIKNNKKIVKDILGIKSDSLIVPIDINNNKKVIEIQKELMLLGFIVGAIRQPTVKSAILRMIIKLDVKTKDLISICDHIKNIE
ncbi:MAG: pyridoxal phosphate-dependent aminotransferase family protein [Campylobacterota bacterium]|nr:pyridoxal phosphate-dependent aminotransferase family protein [Campylobacterota bacterium]